MKVKGVIKLLEQDRGYLARTKGTRLVAQLKEQFEASAQLKKAIHMILKGLGYAF